METRKPKECAATPRPIGVALFRGDGSLEQANAHLLELLGFDAAGVRRFNLLKSRRIPATVKQAFREKSTVPVRVCLIPGTPACRARRPNPALVQFEFLPQGGPGPEHVLMLAQNATALPRHGSAGHENAEMLQALINATTEIVVLVNADGTIHAVNEQGARDVRARREDMLGRRVDDYFPPPAAALRCAKRRQCMETGKPVCFESEHFGRHYDESIYPVFDERGRVARLAVFVRDITEIKKLSREILRISEEEQRKAGQFLHDSVGQDLVGISLLLKALEKPLAESGSEHVAAVRRIRELVGRSLLQVRAWSRGLSPLDVQDQGFETALRGLAEDMQETFGGVCRVRVQGRIPDFDAGKATQLYWITREAVNNAIRHGGATRVTIVARQVDGGLLLAIRDDGKGFPQDPQYEHSGMGIRIMQHRARNINASLHIRTLPRGGVCVECLLPRQGAPPP